jgi:hypothetical protein
MDNTNPVPAMVPKLIVEMPINQANKPLRKKQEKTKGFQNRDLKKIYRDGFLYLCSLVILSRRFKLPVQQ